MGFTRQDYLELIATLAIFIGAIGGFMIMFGVVVKLFSTGCG